MIVKNTVLVQDSTDNRTIGDKTTPLLRLVTLLLSALIFLAACGGGGGGGGGSDAGSQGDTDDGGGNTGDVGGDPSTVVRNLSIPPGAQCANGGVEIEFGIDENGNGVLDAAEVDGSEVICFTTVQLDQFDGPVYVADQEINGISELFRSRLDGSATVNLAPQAFIDADVGIIVVSPDGNWVAYLADQERDDFQDLYAVNLATGRILKISGPMQPTGEVEVGIEWAPDSSRIAYRADQLVDGVIELFVTDLVDGTGNIQISSILVAGRQTFQDFSWAPDSSRIAYRSDQDTLQVFELYTSLPDGTGGVKVSAPLVALGDVSGFAWAPDSSSIAYAADQDVDGVTELYATPPDGSSNDKVSSPLVAGGTVFFDDFRWAPDSSRIAYIADQDVDDVFELYTAFPDGTGGVKVSAPMVANGNVVGLGWAPDSSRIAYRADQDVDVVFELYTALPDGTGGVKISAPLVANGDVTGFTWAPDSSRIAYRADQDVDEDFELYTTLPDGAGSVKVSGLLVANGDVSFFSWAPDSSRIAYQATQDSPVQTELYTALPDGAGSVKVSVFLGFVAAGQVFRLEWAPDSSRIAYFAVVDQGGFTFVGDVYTVLPDGTGSVKVSGPMTPGGNASVFFKWVP